MKKIIDSHIHLDFYQEEERNEILDCLAEYNVESLIAVSQHLSSAKKTYELAKQNNMIIYPAFGYHPEQEILEEKEIEMLFRFMEENKEIMIAVGEVGLPYYRRKENRDIPLQPYIELLEQFIKRAQVWDLPIVLHAVYDDAPIVCSLLEKYSISRAHFHWFKGDAKTTERMAANGYYISITPDVFYENEIQKLVEQYPLSQMMVETDGPWPFEGPFKKQLTHPKMIHTSIRIIAEIKSMPVNDVYDIIYQNTKRFYGI